MIGKIKLAANENPYPLPEELRGKINRIAGRLSCNRYPDANALSLRKEIAAYTGKNYGNIMVGNGSDELILLLLLAFAGNGGRVIFPVPNFTMYRFYARATSSGTVPVVTEKDFSLRWDKLMEAGNGSAGEDDRGLIIISSPNNPTGRLRNRVKIIELLENTDKIVVVDEAYYEFCGSTVIDLVDSHPNLVVLRTLSKAFGLAALRVGYLVAAEETVEKIEEVRSPYNVNSYSQQVAAAVIKNRDLLTPAWQKIKRERIRLESELKSLPGLRPYPSRANFILFTTTGFPEEELAYLLAGKGIKIRYLPDLPVAGDSLRVTAGQPEENTLFLETLREMLL